MIKIVILGGGFAGLRLAQQLAKRHLRAEITLVNREAYQTYTPSLYEVVCGRHPRLVCFSLAESLAGTGVTFCQDTVTAINLKQQRLNLKSGQKLVYDQLILALGMVTNDYSIPGVKEFAFPLKTAQDAWFLRQHIEAEYRDAQDDPIQLAKRKLRFLIAGGGPTGVELAGGLAEFRHRLSGYYGVSPKLTTIEICEAGPEILGGKDLPLIARVRHRLERLGVKIKTKSPILANEVRAVVVGQQREATETLIWTAGLKVPELIQSLAGIDRQRDGRVVVDGYLRALGRDNIWVIGDLAGTPDSGTAQIALHQAEAVAANLPRAMTGQEFLYYQFKKPIIVLPIGERFAVTRIGGWLVAGWFGAVLRRMADLRYLLNILPFSEALATWFDRHRPCPDCQMQLRQFVTTSILGRQP